MIKVGRNASDSGRFIQFRDMHDVLTQLLCNSCDVPSRTIVPVSLTDPDAQLTEPGLHFLPCEHSKTGLNGTLVIPGKR